MFKKKCSLCGGDLSRGICTECGMDNRKSDEEYLLNRSHHDYEPNKSECDDKPLTHVHREPERVAPQRTVNNRSTIGNAPKKKRGCCLTSLIIGIVLFTIVPIAIGIILNVVDEMSGITSGVIENYDWEYDTSNDDYEIPDYEIPEYEFPEYEPYEEAGPLEETGITSETTLESGYYEVGVHLPEGIYDIEIMKSGILNINNAKTGFFHVHFYPDEEVGNIEEDLPLHNGSIISVDAGMKVICRTENASKEELVQIENPVTDTYVLEVGTEAVAGKDFEEGIYDLAIEDGIYGAVELYVPDYTYTDEETGEEFSTTSCFIQDEGEMYHNIYIPEGTRVQIKEEYSDVNTVLFTPAEVTVEDVLSFYDKY